MEGAARTARGLLRRCAPRNDEKKIGNVEAGTRLVARRVDDVGNDGRETRRQRAEDDLARRAPDEDLDLARRVDEHVLDLLLLRVRRWRRAFL